MSRAKYVVLLGPDGSGKTTVADKLAHSLNDEGRDVARKNFSFGFMPPISSLVGRGTRKSTTAGERNSGMVKPLGPAHATLLAFWYGIDHLLGHIYLSCRRKNGIVIFARSYHDFLYQRAYLNLPRALPRFFIAIGPKPDLIATPLRDPQCIHDQKPELTVMEISDQYDRITESLDYYHYFAVINASPGVDYTVKNLRQRVNL